MNSSKNIRVSPVYAKLQIKGKHLYLHLSYLCLTQRHQIKSAPEKWGRGGYKKRLSVGNFWVKSSGSSWVIAGELGNHRESRGGLVSCIVFVFRLDFCCICELHLYCICVESWARGEYWGNPEEREMS